LSLERQKSAEDPCERCSALIPDDRGHYWCPNRDEHERRGEICDLVLLCDKCHGELCWVCEKDFMAPSPGDVEVWLCPACGNTCPDGLMAFFKGEAEITFIGCEDGAS
jgi:hypothetical protein